MCIKNPILKSSNITFWPRLITQKVIRYEIAIDRKSFVCNKKKLSQTLALAFAYTQCKNHFLLHEIFISFALCASYIYDCMFASLLDVSVLSSFFSIYAFFHIFRCRATFSAFSSNPKHIYFAFKKIKL